MSTKSESFFRGIQDLLELCAIGWLHFDKFFGIVSGVRLSFLVVHILFSRLGGRTYGSSTRQTRPALSQLVPWNNVTLIRGRENSFGHSCSNNSVVIVRSSFCTAVNNSCHGLIFFCSIGWCVHVAFRIELMNGSLAYSFQKKWVG